MIDDRRPCAHCGSLGYANDPYCLCCGRTALDEDTIRRWRYQATAVPAVPQDRLWPNRCEELANALLDARAEVERLRDALKQVRDADFTDSEIPDFIRSVLA